ncbi:MAG: exosome complex RNA-binding protein Csl4 [Candidatus Micrarchaeota archaeon]
MKAKVSKKQVVFPGSVLCAEEEFEAGSNTAVLSTGDVVATMVGETELDSGRHTASVKATTRQVIPLERGAIVNGKVVLVKDNVAVVEIKSAEKNGCTCAISNVTAAIPVSQIERGFAKTTKDYFKVGDLVKAEVGLIAAYGIDLVTQAPEYGVVKAFCEKCRNPVRLIGEELRCTNCGFKLFRKTSTDYWLK